MVSITYSADNAGTGTVIDGQVGARVMLRANGGDAEVEIDDHSITLFADDPWTTIEANFNKFEITSGNVDYIVFG